MKQRSNRFKSSLSSVQERLDREHRFLRYVSHELRTPISIIRNNIELVPKIEQLPEPRKSEEQDQLFGRVDRASLNMQYLTEALLWFYRDDVERLPSKQFALDNLVRQLAMDMRNLLDKKQVELQIETDPYMVAVPEIAAQIVLRNIVKNAYQQTLKGCITIQQHEYLITVTNLQADIDSPQHNLGFGFGSQLIDQLSQRLGWKYIARSQQSTYKRVLKIIAKHDLNTMT